MRMSETEKKGITVKIDADLHAQVRQYIEANGMTMAEFVHRSKRNDNGGVRIKST